MADRPERSNHGIMLAPFLVFLCTIPFGDLSVSESHGWLTLTKVGFVLLAAYLAYAVARGWRHGPATGYVLGDPTHVRRVAVAGIRRLLVARRQ